MADRHQKNDPTEDIDLALDRCTRAVPPITAYYDHSCPICREEVDALRSIDKNNALILIDCSAENFSDEAATLKGLAQHTLRNAMHVRDANNAWFSTIDAFIVMYEAVGFQSAANMLRNRRLRPFFEWGYPVFVKWRYRLKFIGAHKIMPWLIRRAAR